MYVFNYFALGVLLIIVQVYCQIQSEFKKKGKDIFIVVSHIDYFHHILNSNAFVANFVSNSIFPFHF